MTDWALSILISTVLALNTLALRVHTHTWLSPSGIVSGFWFLLTFLPLLISPTTTISPSAVGFIALCILALSSSTFLFEQSKPREKAVKSHFCNNFIKYAFYVFGFTSILTLTINSYIQGITINDLLFNFFESSSEYVRKRYSGDIKYNPFSQLSTLSSYMTAICGGLLLHSSKSLKAKVFITAYSLTPSTLVMITQSARGMLFLSISYFVAAFATASFSTGNTNPIRLKTFIKLTSFSIILIPIVAISFLSKGLYNTQDTDYVRGRLVKYFRSYTSGHLFAFSDWFSHTQLKSNSSIYAHSPPAYGFYTFMPIAQALGDDRPVEPGIYTEYFNPHDKLQTNIYTIFRGLITDFGILGSVAAFFAAGILINPIYSNLNEIHKSIFRSSLYISIVGFTYTSFIISLLIWNSGYAVFALTAILFLGNNTYLKMVKCKALQ